MQIRDTIPSAVVFAVLALAQIAVCSEDLRRSDALADWPEFRGSLGNGIAENATPPPGMGPEQEYSLEEGNSWGGLVLSGGLSGLCLPHHGDNR